MEMDWKTNMAELGGAFMVSRLVLGEMDDGSMVMAGLLCCYNGSYGRSTRSANVHLDQCNDW